MIGRLRWWLLPHIGYYCDDTEFWRWYMGPARRLWLLLGPLQRRPYPPRYRRL